MRNLPPSFHGLIFLASVAVVGCTSSGKREPIQLSVGFGLQLHGSATSIVGPRLSLLDAQNKNVTGIDFSGFLTRTDDDVTGLQLAPGANLVGGSTGGLQFATVNYVDGRASGLQLGVYNRTKVLRGLQFGLWNSAENGLLPHLPILNFGWGAAPAATSTATAAAADAPSTDRRGMASSTRRAAAEQLVQEGVAEVRRGDLEGAAASLEKATELDPGNPKAWSNRGVVERRRGNLNRALASFDRAVELDPGYATAWANRGALLYRMERYEAAVQSLQEAVNLGNSKARSWLQKARAKVR